jgi:hypothetical protein
LVDPESRRDYAACNTGGVHIFRLLSRCCPLAKIGYSRDGKRNTPQVNYGLLTNAAKCLNSIIYRGISIPDRNNFRLATASPASAVIRRSASKERTAQATQPSYRDRMQIVR